MFLRFFINILAICAFTEFGSSDSNTPQSFTISGFLAMLSSYPHFHLLPPFLYLYMIHFYPLFYPK